MNTMSYVTRLVADAWEGVHDRGNEIQEPSLADMERAIDRLDGRTHTMVILGTANEAHLAIGGGGGQYLVYATYDNVTFWSLLSSDAPEGFMPLNVGGQVGEYPAKQIVSRDRAMMAARTFFVSGKRESALEWKEG